MMPVRPDQHRQALDTLAIPGRARLRARHDMLLSDPRNTDDKLAVTKPTVREITGPKTAGLRRSVGLVRR